LSQSLHQVKTDTKEQLYIVCINSDETEDALVEAELEGLVEAAGGEIVGWARQRLEKPWKGTYIGSGKVEEVRDGAAEAQADAVVFDCELSGMQIRNLEEALKVRVIDRTQLILDIFAGRAKTREGQLQVELAQLTYMMPRLMSVYTKFERQRGGIGMRGPGETKLESDRRMVRDKISKLKGDIEEVKMHRFQQRAGRKMLPYPSLAIVGYTSAGKSTLMNRICGTEVLVDAMPFATLDPTTRKVDLADGFSFFLTDTVGFIRELPTMLVAAFRATLEETLEADLLLHVVDVSHPDWEIQRDSVNETIADLGAGEIPTLTLFNKVDMIKDRAELTQLVAEFPNSVAVSAKTGEGMEDLVNHIRRMLANRYSRIKALVPYSSANIAETAHSFGKILVKEYREDGIYIEAELSSEHRGRLSQFEVD
jgi:GTP-binding protein HflX